MTRMHSPDNDEGVPWPVRRKREHRFLFIWQRARIPFNQKVLNPYLIPTSLNCCLLFLLLRYADDTVVYHWEGVGFIVTMF